MIIPCAHLWKTTHSKIKNVHWVKIWQKTIGFIVSPDLMPKTPCLRRWSLKRQQNRQTWMTNWKLMKRDFGVIQLLINISWPGILLWKELGVMKICLSAYWKTTPRFPMLSFLDCSKMTFRLSFTPNWQDGLLIGEYCFYCLIFYLELEAFLSLLHLYLKFLLEKWQRNFNF